MPTDALIAQSYPTLINGVSQQPANQRLTSQCEAQVNLLSDAARGIVRRPPMEHVALLTGSAAGAAPTGGYKFHTIDRGDGQKYFAIVEDGDINVYDEDGAEVTVTDAATGSPGTYNYLDFNPANYTAEEAFALTTVADYTFVVNRSKVPLMTTTPSARRTNDHEFLLVIKAPTGTASYNTVALNIDTASRNSGGAANTSDGILDDLCTALCATTSPSATTGTGGAPWNDWRFTRVADNVLYGYQFQNSLDTISAEDKWGDTLHTFIGTGPGGEEASVNTFSDLPEKGVDGFIVKVKGDNGNEQDDFYVVYDDSDKVWRETVKPGLYDSFNADLMPHALVYSAGAFTFQSITWAARLVGDTDSAPNPSFIGNTISDVVVHKNRLILVSDENAVGSESGEFFNFFPTTVTTLVDSDPIDIAGTGNTVALWDFAVPYQGNLTLFSSTGGITGELVGSREDTLTIKNARIEERTSYQMSAVRPVVVGSAAYFLLDQGDGTKVYTYTPVDVDRYGADEITSHIPTFLPANIDRMCGSSSRNIIAFLSTKTGYKNRVYVHRFHYFGNDQVMSSWSYWEIDTNAQILGAGWLQSKFYLFIYRQDGLHLEVMDFAKTDEDEGTVGTKLGYRIHLDSLVRVTGTYDAFLDMTTWVIPYDNVTNGGTFVAVKAGAWSGTRGDIITPHPTPVVDGFYAAAGNYTAQAVYIGRSTSWSYGLSEIFVRATSGQVERGRLTGTLALRRGRVVFKDTGAFNVGVASESDTDLYIDAYAAPDAPEELASGTFDFHIGGHSRDARITFYGSDHYPAGFAAFDWEGRYRQHSDQA